MVEPELTGESNGECPEELGAEEAVVAVRRVTGLDLTAEEDMIRRNFRNVEPLVLQQSVEGFMCSAARAIELLWIGIEDGTRRDETKYRNSRELVKNWIERKDRLNCLFDQGLGAANIGLGEGPLAPSPAQPTSNPFKLTPASPPSLLCL